MQLAPERHDSRIRLDGELTIYRVADLKIELAGALERAARLECDLSGVTEIDSAGFQLLALLKREAAGTARQVAFVGHSPAVLRLLDFYDAAGLFGDPLVISSPGA